MTSEPERKCACPSLTSARECFEIRYERNPHDEVCECRCHEDWDDFGNDHFERERGPMTASTAGDAGAVRGGVR